MKVTNLYRILDVDFNSDQSEIRKAYSFKLFKLHPDHGGEGGSELYKVMKAYEILKDPVKRAYYDSTFMKKSKKYKSNFTSEKKSKKADPTTKYSMTFFFTPKELFNGLNVVVNYKNREFLVKIPEKSYSGRVLRYVTEYKGESLTLELKMIHKKGSEKHLKDNGDLYMDFVVDANRAALGGRESFISPLGESISLFLKGGLRDSQVIRLKGQGMMNRFGTRGDLYISVKIKKVIFSLRAVFS